MVRYVHTALAAILLMALAFPALAANNVEVAYVNASLDGQIWKYISASTPYSTFHDYASGVVATTGTDGYVEIRSTTGDGGFYDLSRFISDFNLTGQLPANATIVGGAYEFIPLTHSTGLGAVNYSITGYAPATNGTASASDYHSYFNTPWSAEQSVVTNSVYNSYPLNAAGLANLSMTGWINIMLRDHWDTSNSYQGLTNAALITNIRVRTSEAGLQYAPRLNITYTQPPAPPQADFIETSVDNNYYRVVSFSDASTFSPKFYSPTNWNWSYQNATSGGWVLFSTDENPTWNFSIAVGSTQAITYDIKLVAGNGAGDDTETKTGYITVSPPAPVASFTGTPLYGTAPQTVTFTDTSQFIPNVWLWNFGDGQTSTTQSPSHTYTVGGYFTVSLTATNNFGTSSNITQHYVTISSANYTSHPYMMFRNITLVPGFQNRNANPWKAYEASIYATRTQMLPGAVWYHICSNTGSTGCSYYANQTVSYLLAINPNSDPINIVPAAGVVGFGEYAMAYDLIAATNGTGTTTLTSANNVAIRDLLAQTANTGMGIVKGQAIDAVSEYDNGMKRYLNIWELGEALHDYTNPNSLTLSSSPGLAADWIKMGTYDMFVSDEYHSITNVATFFGRQASNNEGMFWWEINQSMGGGNIYDYQHEGSYFAGFSWLPTIYSNIYGNVFDSYPNLKKYWMAIVYQRQPNGYNPQYVSDGGDAVDYGSAAYSLLDSANLAYMRFGNARMYNNVNNNLLPYIKPFLIDGKYGTQPPIERYFMWNNSTAIPMYAPTDKNWFGGFINVLRSNWNESAEWISIQGRGYYTQETRGHNTLPGMAVDYYGHGDNLIPAMGEIKYIGWTTYSHPYFYNNINMEELGGTVSGLSAGSFYNEWRYITFKNSIDSSAIGYIDGDTITAPRIYDYRGSNYGPVWNDTIKWNRAIISPDNEYMVVADSLNSTNNWGFKTSWQLGSLNITPTTYHMIGNGRGIDQIGNVKGNLTIGATPYDWLSLPNPGRCSADGTGWCNGASGNATDLTGTQVYTGITTNTIKWDTTNPYGDKVHLNLFSVPVSNVSIMKFVVREAGYDPGNGGSVVAEVYNPHIFLNANESTSLYRLTAFLTNYDNETPATPSAVTVTGTGSALKVISGDTTKTDYMYVGNGTSTFGNYQTDAERAVIREQSDGTVYSFTLINGTFLNKSSAPVFSSTVKLALVSTITKANGTRFNVSGPSGTTNLTFFGVTTPSNVKKDGATLGSGWSMSGTNLTITTSLSDHVLQFGNGNEVDYPPQPVYSYENPATENAGLPTETFTAPSTAADAQISRAGVNENILQISTGAGTDITAGGYLATGLDADGLTAAASPNTGNYSSDSVFVWSANTASIPDNADIQSVWFVVAGGGKENHIGALSSTIVDAEPLDPTNLVIADYNRTQNIVVSQNLSYADFSTTGDNYYYLTNFSVVNKVGYTSLMIKNLPSVDKGGGGLTWSSGGYTYKSFHETSNSTSAPVLNVIYTIPDMSSSPVLAAFCIIAPEGS